MQYKPGDIVTQLYNPGFGNLIILKQIDNFCYKVKYINDKLNNGNYAQRYEDAYIFSRDWIGELVKSNRKSYQPDWL